jgi:hypothetical protein
LCTCGVNYVIRTIDFPIFGSKVLPVLLTRGAVMGRCDGGAAVGGRPEIRSFALTGSRRGNPRRSMRRPRAG